MSEQLNSFFFCSFFFYVLHSLALVSIFMALKYSLGYISSYLLFYCYGTFIVLWTNLGGICCLLYGKFADVRTCGACSMYGEVRA